MRGAKLAPGEPAVEARRRAAGAWLLLGGLQAVMATGIGIMMVAKGRWFPGIASLIVAVLIIVAVGWKRARLKRLA